MSSERQLGPGGHFGPVDHAGYLVAELAPATERFATLFALEPVRRVELPQFSLEAVFLGDGSGGASVELFAFSDPQLRARRLGDAALRLDHVAYRVPQLDALVASLRAVGVRFGGPDLGAELDEPLVLAGSRHLWTFPETTQGAIFQLIEPAPLAAT